jgi:hypothetical protein
MVREKALSEIQFPAYRGSGLSVAIGRDTLQWARGGGLGAPLLDVDGRPLADDDAAVRVGVVVARRPG